MCKKEEDSGKQWKTCFNYGCKNPYEWISFIANSFLVIYVNCRWRFILNYKLINGVFGAEKINNNFSKIIDIFWSKEINNNFSKINDNFMAEKIVSYLKFIQFSRIFSRIIYRRNTPLKNALKLLKNFFMPLIFLQFF